ncbi:hypothetical protein [Actinomycetia phage DSL-LC01]|nr:hypothetical protein [Actinomycetia phage DSL-LC01]
MTEITLTAFEGDDEPKGERPEVQIDEPVNLRPKLSDLGIDEVERGVCQDTYENRAILRRAKMGWDSVYSSNGVPTGLIQARSDEMAKQRRILSLGEKRPILLDPDNMNSDYLTGLDLLAESAADYLVPPWVIGATRAYIKEQDEGGPRSARRKPAALPHRCRAVKDDGLRCMLWSSGRLNDDGYCRVHLRSMSRRPGEDIERARAKLTQSAPYAVDILEDLMQNAASEPVRLKASTEILDRAGVRGGVEFDARLEVTDGRAPAQVVAERLQRLADGAVKIAGALASNGVALPEEDISDAEIIETAPAVNEGENNANT